MTLEQTVQAWRAESLTLFSSVIIPKMKSPFNSWWAFAKGYPLAILATLAITVLMYPLFPQLNTTTIALLYLLPVTLSTTLGGLGPGLVSGLLAFFLYNYYFLKPFHTLRVHQPQDVTALGIFFVVVIVINQLVGRAKENLAQARASERKSTCLYELSLALGKVGSIRDIGKTLAFLTLETLQAEYVEIQIIPIGDDPALGFQEPPGASKPVELTFLSMPFETTRRLFGTIYVWRKGAPLTEVEARMLRTFANQGALALERVVLSQTETKARILEESDRMKSALLSSVSHELRSPLATIKASVTSLLGPEVDWEGGARQDLLETIDEETDHLNWLVGNLLDMSRIEAGALNPVCQWNQLSEILESALQRLHRTAQDYQIEIDFPEDLPLVPVDFMQIERVFVNLISNSAKYAPVGTVIQVIARVQGSDSLIVQVTNQGPPVPQEHLRRIFEKFYRVTDAERVTGTGLGLSICKGIIEAHGGRIWAENLPERFAFNFSLPSNFGGEAAHIGGPGGFMSAEPHILVIDDEPQILRALRTILTTKKFRVSTASSGEEGLAKAAATLPDLVILDLGLTDMSGFTVCSRLREWSNVPIIVLSVRESEQDKVSALDQGADDYLVKPFGIEELLARVRVALRHSAQSQTIQETSIKAGDLIIDLARHSVTRSGGEVKLTATEYKLLAYLAQNPGRMLTHQSLLNKVWGSEYTDDVEYLRVYISQLRKKLEQDPKHPRHILSEPGVGYRFSEGD